MSLEDQLTALYARRRFGIKPGVERVLLLLERLGNPQTTFQSIHVVGTNGKGSTSSFLSSILTSSGLRTGLFTSPHLVRFNERFRINGLEIDASRLTELIKTVLSVTDDTATFFELVTAMAAQYFADEGVIVAVMEAGMGGASDATAAFKGNMVLVTPISLDHCDYLGTTVEEIALEKISIAASGACVIVGTQSDRVKQSISCWSENHENELLWLDDTVTACWDVDGRLNYQGLATTFGPVFPGITGRYQSGNAALALLAAECLAEKGWKICDGDLRKGIEDARWPGRMELVPGCPALLFDGAHNEAGMKALSESLLAMEEYNGFLLVVGMMADKDVNAMLSCVPDKTRRCFCVTPDIERAMQDSVLKEECERLGMDAESCGSVANGINKAMHDAGNEDLVVVCGSLFTVGEAKAYLAGSKFTGIRG